MAARPGLIWDIDFSPLMNTPVELMTMDGTSYKGKLTGVEFQDMEFVDKKGEKSKLQWPKAFQLDGDERDPIGFGVLAYIRQL